MWKSNKWIKRKRIIQQLPHLLLERDKYLCADKTVDGDDNLASFCLAKYYNGTCTVVNVT